MPNFDKIFQNYYHQLLLYSLKFVENEDDARDIIQEVFTAIWENKKFQLEEQHLKAYLFNAVRNACYNYLKHQNVVRTKNKEDFKAFKEMELGFYKSSEKSLIEKEDLDKIYSIINALPDNYKEVIELSRFEGLKNKEIALELNIPVRTVETRLFRALARLRKNLTEKQIIILFNFSRKNDLK